MDQEEVFQTCTFCCEDNVHSKYNVKLQCNHKLCFTCFNSIDSCLYCKSEISNEFRKDLKSKKRLKILNRIINHLSAK